MRGCATDIFAVANTEKKSIDYDIKTKHYTMPMSKLALGIIESLYHVEMCTYLPIKELWPEFFSNLGELKLFLFFLFFFRKNIC